MLGTLLFAATVPDKFGDLGRSALTVFQIVTGDGWAMLMAEGMRAPDEVLCGESSNGLDGRRRCGRRRRRGRRRPGQAHVELQRARRLIAARGRGHAP